MVTSPCDRGVILAGDESSCAQAARPWVLVATILGSSMAFIDGTVVNVALPALQRELGATATDVQWVIEAYALFLSALLLVGGSLGDHFGRRRIYELGVAIFAAASAACGLAPTTGALVAARVAQGIGAALLVPGSLAIISATFPGPERGRAIGIWSGFSAMTTAIGPVLGGWLIEHLSWRWAFFVNLPIAVIVLIVLRWRVPESRDPQAAKGLDLLGAALVTLGLGGIVFALIESSHLGWRHPAIVTTLTVGAIALVAFVMAEVRESRPMVPLRLFRSPAFAGANLITLFLYAALNGVLFFLPLDLIQVQHYGPTAAGASFLPFIALMFVLSRWSGGLVERFGSKLPLTVGPAITAVGFALFARPSIGGDYWSTFFPAILVMGLGMAVSVAPLTTTVMNAVDPHQSGIASGINNTVSRVAGLLAIALMGLLMLGVFGAELDRRISTSPLRPAIAAGVRAERIRLGAIHGPPGTTPTEKIAIEKIVGEAFVSGFRSVAWVSAALALMSALAAWLLVPGQRPRRIVHGKS